MKCGCKLCGTFMDHVEKGDKSYCICPECMDKCSDCLGINPKFSFLDRETAKKMKENTQKAKNKKV